MLNCKWYSAWIFYSSLVSVEQFFAILLFIEIIICTCKFVVYPSIPMYRIKIFDIIVQLYYFVENTN